MSFRTTSNRNLGWSRHWALEQALGAGTHRVLPSQDAEPLSPSSPRLLWMRRQSPSVGRLLLRLLEARSDPIAQ